MVSSVVLVFTKRKDRNVFEFTLLQLLVFHITFEVAAGATSGGNGHLCGFYGTSRNLRNTALSFVWIGIADFCPNL